MFQKISLKLQVGAAFFLLVTAFFAVLVFISVQVSELSSTVEIIDNETLPLVLAVDQMNLSRSDVQQFLTDVSATHEPDGYKDAEEANRLFHENVATFKSYFRRTRDDAKFKELKAIEAHFDNFYAIGKTMAQTYVKDGMEAGNALMKGDDKQPGFDKASDELLDSLTNFRKSLIKDSKTTTTNARSAVKTIEISILVSGGLALVLALALAVAISKPIAAQIDSAVKVADALAKGDLGNTFEANGSSELVRLMTALQHMQTNFTTIVDNVRQSSKSVAFASAEIAQGNQDLFSRTEKQASVLEETAASMQELGTMVQHNAALAQQANQLAINASTMAMTGGKVVDLVVDTMKGINDSSKKIADIISVIDGIAFQTNILALNAAVEAARAGEMGSGFAVVANEVRSLAGRSAGAAKEIKILIHTSVERVKDGSMLADQAGVTMTDVVESIHKVNQIMAQISAASVEQNRGVLQVSKAVSLINQTTQQNAALVEQMAAAAGSLNAQATDLVNSVALFNFRSG